MGHPDYSENYISTSALARLLGIQSNKVFSILESNRYLEKQDGQWYLTPSGEDIGGVYGSVGGPAQFPIWPRTLAESDIFQTIIAAPPIAMPCVPNLYGMNSEGGYFAEYFTLAQSKALTTREIAIVELRYGLTGGDTHTLEAVGQEIGVSRERIRQIVEKSIRKIVSKGQRELKNGKSSEPCAELLSYVRNVIRPQDEEAISRLVDFVERDLPYLPGKFSLPLVLSLAFQKRIISVPYIGEALKIYNQRKIKRLKEYQKKALSDKFQDLLASVIWPGAVSLLTTDGLERKRNVSLSGEGKTGVFHSSKMNRTVEYESELEFDFFQRLEQLDEVVVYQEQPFIIPYEYEGKNCFYYPDVLLVFKDNKGVVVEIKPLFKMALHININKWTGMKRFCADKGLGILITDGRYTIQQLQLRDINQGFANDVLALLKKGPLNWAQYKQIRDEHGITRNDFLALVLKKNLIWKLNPFMLSVA